jgi:hypothetical protein
VSIPQNIFVNIYPPFAGQIGTAYATRELADQMAARGRVACIFVELSHPQVGGRCVGAVLPGDLPSFSTLATK